VSWLPTIKIARAAWKGRQDPAGLLKAQLSGEQQPAQTRASLPAPAVAAAAPAGPAIAPPAAAAVAEPVAQPHEHATHTHLLLLLR
jgi:hypothetical protein